MTTRQFGTKVFEKTSWGKKQAKAAFNIEFAKSNVSSDILASLLSKQMLSEVGFGIADHIIHKIIYTVMCIDSSYGYKNYMKMLKTIWEEDILPVENEIDKGEFRYLKWFFNKMKAECEEGTTIGKNQIQRAALKHSIDLLDHI